MDHNKGNIQNTGEQLQEVQHVSGMYESWFLDYASYVILERAVPAIQDGLKPVQRRILHAMKEMDDGRFNKGGQHHRQHHAVSSPWGCFHW
jgi:topoisomerase-4 subunit A